MIFGEIDCAEVFCMDNFRFSGVTLMDGQLVMDNLGSTGDIDVAVQEVIERTLEDDLILLKENNLLMLLNFLLGLLFLEGILHTTGIQLDNIWHNG